MDISKINSNLINNTLNEAKSSAVDGDFEKKLKDAVAKKDDTELRKVCDDFEQIFLGMMYKGMKATVQKSDLVQEDSGRKIFESMMDDEMVKKSSETKTFGLSNMLYKQLSKQLKNKQEPEK